MTRKHIILAPALFAFMFLQISCQETANNPSPSVTSLSPDTATAGGTGFLLTVNGKGFAPQALIYFNGLPRTDTQYLSGNAITTMVQPADIANPGTINVQVVTPAPGGGSSGILPLTVQPGQSGVPQLISISPSSVFAGGPGFSLTLYGTGFNSTSVVTLDNGNRTTTFINNGQLQASILSSDLMTAGVFAVGVTNPPPGGGASNTLSLVVTNPPPVIVGISPVTFAAQPVDNAGTTLGVIGSGFDSASQVNFNGSPRTTTLGTQNSISAPLLSNDLITAGTFPITVVNPAPGGGTSNAFGFSVIAGSDGLGLPEQINVSTAGIEPNAGTTDTTTSGPAISSNGEYTAFASAATNLVIGDNNNVPDVFYQNNCIANTTALCAPATILGSAAGGNTQANGPSSQPSVENSGRYIAFVSTATNLIPGNNNFDGVTPQVFWRDTCAGVTTACNPFTILVSVAADGVTPGNSASVQPSLSPDGRYVAFSSAASNLQAANSSGVAQIFIFDTCLNASDCTVSMTVASLAPDGVTLGNAASAQPSLGSLASWVAFSSSSTNLLSAGLNGLQQVFQRSTCIGATGCTPLTVLVSTPDGSTPANSAAFSPSMGSNGRVVAFASSATNLVSIVTGGIQQVFLRDTCTGASGCTPSTSLVSLATNGAAGNAASEHPSIDAAGQYVAFASFAANLVAVDTNNLEDVFVRNTCATVSGCTPATILASISAANGGVGVQGNGNSLSPAISPDATVVCFLSFATNLVPQPVPAQANVFLASTTF